MGYNKSQDKTTQYIDMTFIPNKYTTWYYNIISSSKTRILSEDVYTEKHHIMPKSLGGGNEESNIAVLTAREHFICHILLTKMTKGRNRSKMVYAARMMCIMENSPQHRYVNSHLYKSLKEHYSQMLKGHPHFGPFKQSEESNRKRSVKLKGIPKGPMSEKTKKILSDQRKGKSLNHTKEHRLYLAARCKEFAMTRDYNGDKNPFYGKKHTEETLEKMRKPRTEEHKRNISRAAKNRPPPSEETKRKISETLKKRKKILCCEKWYDAGNLARHRASTKVRCQESNQQTDN